MGKNQIGEDSVQGAKGVKIECQRDMMHALETIGENLSR